MRSILFVLMMCFVFVLNAVSCGKAEAPVAKETIEAVAPAEDCTGAKNTCADYSPYWATSCPAGSRCIAFKNSCTKPVALAYQIGCNGDGTKGAPAPTA